MNPILYHPTLLVFTATLLLTLLKNNKALFSFVSIIYPALLILSISSLPNTLAKVSLLNIVILADFSEHNTWIALAFAFVLLAANLFALSLNSYKEIIFGSAYAAFTYVCLFADDMLSLFTGLELMMCASAALIFTGASPSAINRTTQYLLTHITSGALLLLGIVYITVRFENSQVINVGVLMDNLYYSSIFNIMFLGLIINIAAFPFCGWMIECYEAASPAGFVYLISFTTKVSVVVLAKFFTGYQLLEYVGIAMIIYAGIKAFTTNSLRALLCYLSIVQMGFMAMALSDTDERIKVAIFGYLAIHILYKALLSVIFVSGNVELGRDVKTNNMPFKIFTWFSIMIGIAIMANFPYTTNCILKYLVLDIKGDKIVYYAASFATIIAVASVPFRAISISKKHANLFYYSSVLVLILATCAVALLNNYFNLLANYYDYEKPLLLIIIGLAIGLISRSRYDVKTFNLLAYLGTQMSRILALIDNNKNSKKRKANIGKPFHTNLNNIAILQSQKVAIFIVFLFFTVIFFTLIILKPYEAKAMIPKAEKIEYSSVIHNTKLEDEYFWLRDKEWPKKVSDPKILSYLNAENKHFEDFILPKATQKEALFEELKGRIKLADQSTYVKKDDYYYYSRTEEDKDYPIYCRKHSSTDAKEEILLNINELASGKKFTRLSAFTVSPKHNLIAYSVDFSGSERYTIRVFDLVSKKYLEDEIPDTIGDIVWHEEIGGFFYTPTDENWRHDRVMFHKLGDNFKQDKLVFKEEDNLYFVQVDKSSSRDYIFIEVGGHDSSETFYVDMKDHNFTPKLIKKRQDKIQYTVDHDGNYFYMITNENAKNFHILRASGSALSENGSFDWHVYIAEDKDKYLSGFDISKNYILLNYKAIGLPVIIVKNTKTDKENTIKFPDSAYTASGFSTNFKEDDLRIDYSSLGRPSTVFSYDFTGDKLTVLKTQEIPSGFNPDEYNVERLFAQHDGVRVPISIFYKKSLFKKDGSNPVYLYGYGSYGIAVSPTFRNSAVSLADRGFIYAIAHIRGGDDLGHDWYEDAKFLNKKRTFNDFISSAEFLIKEKYTSKGNIVICGGSAGGLLIGYVINERPELFKAAIAHVPFVDVMNTMLDESLPLTPHEFKEWGNPKEEEYFKYMLSYSPYDNVKAQQYPCLFVTAGLSDPRVGYWEAAKWVARLREKKTDNNLIIFKTNMEFGHQGASGRFDYLKEAAEDLVFVFDNFGR